MNIPNLFTITNSLTYQGTLFAAMNDEQKKRDYLAAHPKEIAYLQKKLEGYLHAPLVSIRFQKYKAFDTTGDRDAFQDEYFDRKKRLNVFCMAYHLWGNETYLKEAEDTIWAICDEYSWCLPAHLGGKSLVCPKHQTTVSEENGRILPYPIDHRHQLDLFSCETAKDLAEAMRILGDAIDPLVRHRAITEITDRIFTQYLNFNAFFHFEMDLSNWSSVCGSSIGIAALYLIDDPALLAPVIQRVISDLDVFLSSYGEDGIGLEGVEYWYYGFSNFLCFADLLREKTEGKLNLFEDEKVKKVAFFPAAAYLYQECCVNFSDCNVTAACQREWLSYLLNIYPDMPVPTALSATGENKREELKYVLTPREIYWDDVHLTGVKFAERLNYYPSAQWLVSCKRVNDRGFSFVIKGGHNNEPHNHNDLGHFMICVNDTPLLCDLGSGQYTKEYFGDGRYDYLVNSSKGHSVPIIDHTFQTAGAQSRAKILSVDVSDPKTASIQMDLSSAYCVDSLTQFVRSATVLREEGNIQLTDTFSFSKEELCVTERFVSEQMPVVTENGVLIQKNGATLRIASRTACKQISVEPETFIGHDLSTRTAYLINLDYVLTPESSCIALDFCLEMNL